MAAALLAVALLAWVLTYRRMRGMDDGPWTNLGNIGWFVGAWVTMMAAMMLPAVAPMAITFARMNDDRGIGTKRTWVLVAGYLVAWTGYGLLAYALFRVVWNVAPSFLSWDHAGRYVAAAALVGAGAYELTPLKRVCLRHCRAPIHFIAAGWRDGTGGALRMGLEHGAFCVGCCWGLMLALFALGVMSIAWMLGVALLIFAQKVLPVGERVVPASAVVLSALAIWVGAAPGSIPGLEIPHPGNAAMVP